MEGREAAGRVSVRGGGELAREKCRREPPSIFIKFSVCLKDYCFYHAYNDGDEINYLFNKMGLTLINTKIIGAQILTE